MKRGILNLTVSIFMVAGLLASPQSEATEDRFQSLYEQAKKEQGQANYKMAIKLFRKVGAKSALSTNAFAGLIECYVATKDWNSAIEALQGQISAKPFEGSLRMSLADIYIKAEKFEQALAEINHAEKLLGPEEAVLKAKAQTLQKLNRHAEAIKVFDTLLVINPKIPEAFLERSLSLVEIGDLDKAHLDMERAYALRPFEEKILEAFANLALKRKKYKDVRVYGQKCLDYYPKNTSCFESLGQASLVTKNYPKAIDYFEAAVVIDPSNLEHRVHYAEALSAAGRNSECDQQFQTVLKSKVDNEPAMRSWHAILSQRASVKTLGENLAIFNSHNKGNLWCAVELSKLLVVVGQEEQALERMSEVTKETDSDLAKLYFASFLEIGGRYDRAQEVLGEIKSEKIEKQLFVGNLLLRQNKVSEAMATYASVKDSSPHYFKAQYNLAIASAQLGNIARAKEILSAIVAPDKYKPEVEKSIVKLVVLGSRSPAAASPEELSEMSYIYDWELPPL